MGVVEFLTEFIQASKDFHATLSPSLQSFVILFFLVLIIVIYSVFVWKLHEFIGTKNIFRFDLNQYNTSKNPVLSKIIASGFYLLEYILIVPFIIFFWFIIFSFFLMLLMEESFGINTILIVSAIVIASIRMSSYIPKYGEKLARELAKLFPFTFLAIAVLEPNIFANLIERFGTRVSELSLFFSGAINYFLFIIILEVVLRFFEFVFDIAGLSEEEPQPEQQDQQQKK